MLIMCFTLYVSLYWFDSAGGRGGRTRMANVSKYQGGGAGQEWQMSQSIRDNLTQSTFIMDCEFVGLRQGVI